MTVKEFYEKSQGDYQGVISRLMTEERILKYLRKFPASGDYENLQKALEESDWELAFRSSHNLKGMCLNLGLSGLFEPSSIICENLRGGSPKEDCGPLMAAVTEKWNETIALINEL